MRLYDANAAAHSLARAVEHPLPDTTLVLMFDGDYPDLVALEAAKCFEMCRANQGTELPARLAELWWDRRYVFYYPPYAPELPSIWGTVDVVADFEHIEAVYYETTKAIHASVPAKWNLSLNTHFSHWYEWGSMIYARMKIPTGPADLAEAKALHDAVFKAGTEAALKAGAVLNDSSRRRDAPRSVYGTAIRRGHGRVAQNQDGARSEGYPLSGKTRIVDPTLSIPY